MDHAVMIDFGSTYTKVACVDLREARLVTAGSFPSTVGTDARIGLEQCLSFVREEIGAEALERALKLSSSSAAGGLRMAVIGITERLSSIAGRHTAFGAGGKIVKLHSGLLTKQDVEELENSNAEIILLCGGYERGNRTIVLGNAKMLADSQIHIPVIYAGNSSVATEAKTLLTAGGKECFVANNVIPNVGELNTEAAGNVIRSLFMQRIVNMKGIGCIKELIGDVLMPTPAAVLKAGELLSVGTESEPGLGNMMMVDVGGATTDIYSFCENQAYEGSKIVGAKEPFAKRTVEGDMGMRESSICILQEVGEKKLAADASVDAATLQAAISNRHDNIAYLADTPQELDIDQAIAQNAVAISVRRHAGRIEHNCIGTWQNQMGKNLTEIKTLIGTGGVIVKNRDPKRILERAMLQKNESKDILIPRELSIFVDSDYIFYAAGLLSSYSPETAIKIMKNSLR